MEEKRVLVAYASERGSTAEIADAVGEALRRHGLVADSRAVAEVANLTYYAAVIVGSAVYANRWRKEAIRFLTKFRTELAERPVWIFQTGPLDHSADEGEIPLPAKIAALAQAIGVRDHATFGGRLAPDPKGWIAKKMAQGGRAGDFRNFDRIREWAEGIAQLLTHVSA